MTAALNILWFIGMALSIHLVFVFVGFSGLTNMFPEGKRMWHLPAQLATLLFFAGMVLCNPFTTVAMK